MSLLKDSPLNEEAKENSLKKVPTLQEFLKKVSLSLVNIKVDQIE